MPKGSDNPFPSLLIVEGTAPASPSAGRQRVFIDSADNRLKRKNSSGVVTCIDTPGTIGALLTAVNGLYTVEVPYAGVITAARIFGFDSTGLATSGSAVVDIWKDTYANFQPTVADTITASAKPTLSSASKNQDTTLAGWTTAFSAGDIFVFKLESLTTITQVLVQLTTRRT